MGRKERVWRRHVAESDGRSVGVGRVETLHGFGLPDVSNWATLEAGLEPDPVPRRG